MLQDRLEIIRELPIKGHSIDKSGILTWIEKEEDANSGNGATAGGSQQLQVDGGMCNTASMI